MVEKSCGALITKQGYRINQNILHILRVGNGNQDFYKLNYNCEIVKVIKDAETVTVLKIFLIQDIY